MNSNDTHNATFSLASPDGHSACNSQDGQQIDLFGQAHALASRFHLPDDKRVKQTIGTYGPSGNVSSASAALQQSMENRLKTLLPTGGLTMFIKGWKRKATPSHRLYCQLSVAAQPQDSPKLSQTADFECLGSRLL